MRKCRARWGWIKTMWLQQTACVGQGEAFMSGGC